MKNKIFHYYLCPSVTKGMSDLVMKVFSQYRMKRLPKVFVGCYTGRAGEIPAFN